MTKFAFFTDSHLAGESPRHRVDNFPQALLSKMREVYSVAEAEGCSFVTFGGDWFNTHRIFSYDVIADAMDIVCESKLKTYMVVGEHDLYGHQLKTYNSSTLAFFIRRCGMIEVLWEPKVLGEVVLYGKHEPDKMADVLIAKTDPSKFNVLVCHELLTDNTSAPFEVVCTASILNNPFDLVLSGDLHCGFDTHFVGKTWYCNPGSLARRTTSEVNRMPQMAIIEVEAGKPPRIQLRRLKSAKVGSEVFGENIADVARIMEESDADGFAKELLEFESESSDIHDLVQKAGSKSNIRKEVLDYLATKRTVAKV